MGGVALGALGGVACFLAGLLEVQGFGIPGDGGPRLGYLLLLALGFVASVAVPLALWRLLFPDSGPALPIVGAVAATALILALLGVGIAR